MFSTMYLVLVIVCAIPIIILIRLLRKSNIPNNLREIPKTSGWPLVGVLFSIKEPLYAYLFRLTKKHGPIFKFTMGCREIIVLNTNTIMKKTLKEMGNNFSGRWQNVMVQVLYHNSGILFKDKEWWVIQRSFALKVLKDFGLGKKRTQEIVTNECSIVLKEIENLSGKVTSTRQLFPKFMVNVIAKLVMNVRFERSDKNFQVLTDFIEKHAHRRNLAVSLILMYPILEEFPRFSKLLLWCCGRSQESKEGYKYIEDIIKDHEKRFSPENEGEDLIDVFLLEKYKLDKTGVKDHTFTYWQINRVVYELFAAGYETTSTTLSWSMLLLAKHQNIQEKVYQEIVDVVGLSRSPSLEYKKSLNYTSAVMDEIFRFSSLVPLSVPHRVFEDASVDGYFIPKNSIIYPNLYAVHHDTDTWEKPFEFYPEHFLIKTNEVLKYTPREDLIPFCIGKRQCLGESLARLEFLTFLISILQRFQVCFENEMSEERFKEITVGTPGLVRAPLNTDVIFNIRK